MTDHVQLGAEILSLDFDSLLCPACSARIEAAKAAQRALQQLNNLVTDQPAVPPPKPPIPGSQLSRSERLERGRLLLAAGSTAPPQAAVTTSNGTVLAQPWRHGPRKAITKTAERDIEKVAMGTMSASRWCSKHGYSNTLLKTRLELRAQELDEAKARTVHVPPKTYKSTKGKLTEDQLRRAINGELSPRQLALELQIPVGSVYRHLDKHRERAVREKKRAGLGLTREGKPRKRRKSDEINPTDEELQGIYDGKYTQRQIADRYQCSSTSMIARRYLEWQAKKRLPERKRAAPPESKIDIADEDLRRLINKETSIGELAEKYGCTHSVISYRAKMYGLRFGIPDEDAGPSATEEALISKLAQVTAT